MEIMPILERKIAHKMTTLCSHITYPEFVLPLHKHAEYELMIFTHGSGKQFVGEGVAPYTEGDVALIGSNVPHLHLCKSWMKYGIRFYDEGLYDELLEMMKAFDSSTHTSRLIILLQILDRLHHCKKTQLLSSTAYSNANRQPELEEPIGRIYTYFI